MRGIVREEVNRERECESVCETEKSVSVSVFVSVRVSEGGGGRRVGESGFCVAFVQPFFVRVCSKHGLTHCSNFVV